MRLIDADALKEKVVDADYVPTGKWLRLSDLEDAPTVDAVPVVRCVDCKHRPTKRMGRSGRYLDFPDYKCPFQCDDPWYNREPPDDWFCPKGESGFCALHRPAYESGKRSAEQKHGKWIYTEVREYPVGYNRAECSHCNWSIRSRPGEKWILTAEEVARDFYYCPNCGAMMERSEE